MKRILTGIVPFLIFLTWTEAAAGPPEESSDLLGRWNVTAVQGERSYPLWFEIEAAEDGYRGRFQPRGGHSRPMEALSIDGNALSFECCNVRLQGQRTSQGLAGQGISRERTFQWTARRAPRLPAREEVRWGDPIDLSAAGLQEWQSRAGAPEGWSIRDGALAIEEKGVNIFSRRRFDDFKLHIEVNFPEGSNSGIYLRGRYEIQIIDDQGKPPYNRGIGAVYGYITPTANAAGPAGSWQIFDVTLTGRWVTVVLNGKTIIDHQEIPGTTGGAMDSREAEPGPLYLQGDHGGIAYRNIIVTPALPEATGSKPGAR